MVISGGSDGTQEATGGEFATDLGVSESRCRPARWGRIHTRSPGGPVTGR